MAGADCRLTTPTPAGGGQAPRTQALPSRTVNRSIASEGMFHSDFLRAMNKMANELAADHAAKILAAAAA